MYWLNIDFPTKQCTVHRQNCNQRPKKEPKYKGFGTLKRDGGWLSFKTTGEAEFLYRSKYQGRGYKFVRCSYCRA
jgi:hypothetical protein